MRDFRLGVYNAILVVLAPVLLGKKLVKFRRRGHAHEWDFARWKAPVRRFVDEAATSEREHPSRMDSATSFVDESETLSIGQDARAPIRVVFVALSWGEVGVLHQISTRLETARPDVEIVWSIRERAAQEQARSAFPTREVVSMPFDFAVPVARWLEAVAPDVLVVVEKFWWPNLVWNAKRSGARVVLVNGRSRGRERARYKLMAPFQRWILGAFDALCFESAEQIERVREVLPRGANAIATGQVKFGFERASPPPKSRELEAWIDSRALDENGPLPLLIAGSTAPEDEELVLQTWQLVRAQIPCALLIAPRRVGRAQALVDEIEKQHSRVSRRSSFDFQEHGAEILVLDSMGELSFAYKFARAAYVGGALSGRGHNIIEPISWGVGVAYGPNRGDFESAQRAAEEWEVGARVRDVDELAAFWIQALVDEAWRREVMVRCEALLDANRGALELVVEVLGRELDKVEVGVRGEIPLPPGEGG